jgi:integrase
MGLVRTLKTRGSDRKVPLVGFSLWAAKRAVSLTTKHSGVWLFPRYVGPDRRGQFVIKSGSADASANKWLKAILGTHRTSHCFRHTLKDRLAALEVPESIYGAIGGWGSRSMAQQYGDPYGLSSLRVYQQKLLSIAI